MIRILLFSITSIVCIYACNGQNQTVYAYVVVKSTPDNSHISDWRPVMRVKYHLHPDSIISEVAGLLDEYENCEIKNKNNWQCQYEDGMGRNLFGFVKGQYFSSPGWGVDIKHVSRWKYNSIRCKWYRHDDGNIMGLFSCLKTYV